MFQNIKIIPVFCLSFFAVFLATIQDSPARQKFPKPSGYVNDFAGVLSPPIKLQMERLAQELEQKTGAEVVVVTMNTIGDYDYTDYANRLFEQWGIGKKGKDNGVLILDVVDIRKIRLEIGYGVEGILPDGRAGEIRDRYMVPYLRRDDYDTGLKNGLAAVAGIIANDAGVQLTGSIDYVPRSAAARSRDSGIGRLIYLAVMILLFMMIGGRRGRGIIPLLLLSSMMGGGRRHWGGGGFGGGFGGFGGGLSGGGGAGGGY